MVKKVTEREKGRSRPSELGRNADQPIANRIVIVHDMCYFIKGENGENEVKRTGKAELI